VRRRAPAEIGAPAAGEGGTAIIGTLVGFVIFMVLLLFAVQTLIHLYAISALGSAANNAADAVADSGGSPAEVPAAEASARAALGRWGARHTTFEWLEVGPEEVRLEVIAESPALVPLPASYRRIVRTVTVRTERFR
jgi:hypothetical protein